MWCRRDLRRRSVIGDGQAGAGCRSDSSHILTAIRTARIPRCCYGEQREEMINVYNRVALCYVCNRFRDLFNRRHFPCSCVCRPASDPNTRHYTFTKIVGLQIGAKRGAGERHYLPFYAG